LLDEYAVKHMVVECLDIGEGHGAGPGIGECVQGAEIAGAVEGALDIDLERAGIRIIKGNEYPSF
jgi:hypothetical protein